MKRTQYLLRTNVAIVLAGILLVSAVSEAAAHTSAPENGISTAGDNDDFANAVLIEALPYTSPTLDTSLASQAWDDPYIPCVISNQGQATLWYQYTPSASSNLVIDTFSSDYDTVLAVYTGARGHLNPVACGDDTANSSQSQVAFAVAAGTSYYIEVATLNEMGGMLTLHVSALETPPGAFSKVTPSNGLTNQAKVEYLSWNYTEYAHHYEFCLATVESCAAEDWISTGSDVTGFTGDLQPSTTYYWQVRAVNPIDVTYANGSANAFWSFRTGDAPAAFLKVGPTNNATSQPANPTLSWQPSEGLNVHYEYCYSTTEDSCTYSADTYTYGTSVQLSSLAPNTKYYWSVQAVNVFGSHVSNGSPTDWSFTTGSLPGTFSRSGPANGAINQPANLTLNWTPSSGATEYRYCFVTTAEDCASQWTTVLSGTSVNKTGLNPNITYYWNVEARNSFGPTAPQDGGAPWSFTTGTRPGAFTKSGPANAATNQPINPTLGWGTASGTDVSYRYCYSTKAPCNTWNGTSNTSIQLSMLSPNTKYYWNVRAINTFGTVYSNASATDWSFTTLPSAFQATPTSWNFGIIKAGTTSTGKAFIVKNAGDTNLVIGTATLAGTDASQFRITTNSCSGRTLAPNAICSLTVTFGPMATGAKTAYVNIPDNAIGNPHHIPLSGKGGTEQALNGGFNTYTTSTPNIPSGWRASNFASSDGKNTQYKYEGIAAVKMGNTSLRTKTLTQTRAISGAKGSSFLLSLWTKGQSIPTTAGAVQAQVLLYNGTALVQTSSLTLPNGSYGFTKKSLAVTASGAYTKVVIRLTYSKGSGMAWFDALSLLSSP